MSATVNNAERTHWIFGFHPVTAALRSPANDVVKVLVREGRDDRRLRELSDLAKAQNVPFERADSKRFEKMFGEESHQDVAAEQRTPVEPHEDALYEMLETRTTPVLLLVLDEVTDPRNFGALLRVADGAGVHGVVTTHRRSAPLSAVVLKTAAGAAQAVPIYRVTNLARTLGHLKESGVWIVGLADQAAPLWHEVDLRVPCAVVVGAEGEGLRRLTMESCDALISIPMSGVAESLNVAVAAGIGLYEAWRQRQ